ncbi:MAG: LytTR family transcriptional regulator [Paludibacteraceae bacterium]|nr:LytTR family transcriptional regulator [Paludibacteraceae bacterium]
MQEIKLQIGCLLLSIYIIVRYSRLSKFLGIEKSRIFERLSFFAIIELCFDAATAYSVNHIGTIPPLVNDILHWGFFLSLIGFCYCILEYFYLSVHVNPKNRNKVFIPLFVVGAILVTATMPYIHYIKGDNTSYSMGIPVYVCFGVVACTIIETLIELYRNWSVIENRERANATVVFMSTLIISTIQLIFPQALFSSLVPLFILVSAYINQEDPVSLYLQAKQDELQNELEKINIQLSKNKAKETKQETSTDQITITGTTQENVTLSPSDFLFAEAEGNYISIYFKKDGKAERRQLRQTMKQLAFELEEYPRIMRIHRAFLVNLDQISRVDGNSQGYRLKIDGYDGEIPVSRGYIADFNEAIAS